MRKCDTSLDQRSYSLSQDQNQKQTEVLEKIKSIYGGNIFLKKNIQGQLIKSWEISSNNDFKKIFHYFDIFSIKNPYKIAKLKGLKKFRFFIEREDHKSLEKKKKLLKYID